MPDSSATRKAALWVGAVFVLGTALGGVLGYLTAHHSTSAATQSLSEPERRAHRVEQITRELSLTPTQSQQIDAILKEWHAETKAIRAQADAQTDAQIEQVRQKGRDQIRAILTPDQKPKFEEFLKRLDEERKHKAPVAR